MISFLDLPWRRCACRNLIRAGEGDDAWLRPDMLRRVWLLARPDTALRWHRDLIKGQHAAGSPSRRPRRPADCAFHPGL